MLAVDLYDVAYQLEREKTDANGQDDVQCRPGYLESDGLKEIGQRLDE